ncbi:MAG: DUF4118 domain-containing protein [Micavibrio sp.]|nr:DUF4118 domain-containing protein [Micavibrio sp.]
MKTNATITGLQNRWQGYALSAALVAMLTVSCHALRPMFTPMDIIMVYLVGAVAIAAGLGRGAAVFYSALAVSAFNYFFVEPLYSFNFYNSSYWLTFTVMFLACIVISTLAARLREQVLISQQREEYALVLYELTRDLAAATSHDAMTACLLRHLSEKLGIAATVRQDTPAARPHYAVAGAQHNFGHLAITGKEPPPEKTRLLETCAGLLGAALERIETASAAENAKIIAEKEKARSVLLSSVSHDLRSPLAAISGAAETLMQKSGSEPLLKSIHQESARLTRMVSNLLDVTRMEGENIRLNMRAYEPAEIIGSAVTAAASALASHTLSLRVEGHLPFVRMDGLLISQLLQNLLENAARHTAPGTQIELGAYMREGSLCLTVADGGAGIPAGRERDIFNKFVTLSQGAGKGAGLGLAICHAIVTAHHGIIYAANRKEGGARFVVELPPALTLPPETEA